MCPTNYLFQFISSRRSGIDARHGFIVCRFQSGINARPTKLEFAGSVMVISHDRWFLDRIATHILACEGGNALS